MRKYKNSITLSLGNIILFSRNITSHFTGKEKIITLSLAIIMLSFANIINTSALSFQSQNRVDFTFRPTVTVTLSPVGGGVSSDLLIDNLPVNSSDVSNAINVGVATNTLGGILLNATVGNENIAVANVTSLNHTNTANSNKFASIATDANLASLTTANTWGYATSTDSGSSWSNYNGLPAYNAEAPATLLDITPNPYAEPSSGSIQFRIGAKTSSNQASGSYTNTINFTAVTKPLITTYTITYNDNSGAGVDIPPSQSGSINTDGATVALSSTTPTRSGYAFAGWCTVSTNDNTCSGAVYQAGDNYPIANVGGAVTMNLYAMWALPTINDIEYLQDFAISDEVKGSIISSMASGTTYTKKDKRDEQNYTIAKLADGKIWMTKNLNLAGGTEITSELSDVPANYTLPTANGFQEGNKLPVSSQAGFDDNTMAYVYNSGNNTDNCTNPGCYSYYSWNAVTAGSGVGIAANADAPYSICPKGWRLPNSANSDFSGLVTVYGSGENFYHNAGPSTVANFLLAGYVGSFGGGNGLYYMSTSTNSTVSKIMRFWPTLINSSTDFYKKYGLSVRCLVK